MGTIRLDLEWTLLRTIKLPHGYMTRVRQKRVSVKVNLRFFILMGDLEI